MPLFIPKNFYNVDPTPLDTTDFTSDVMGFFQSNEVTTMVHLD